MGKVRLTEEERVQLLKECKALSADIRRLRELLEKQGITIKGGKENGNESKSKNES